MKQVCGQVCTVRAKTGAASAPSIRVSSNQLRMRKPGTGQVDNLTAVFSPVGWLSCEVEVSHCAVDSLRRE